MKPMAIIYMDSCAFYPAVSTERQATNRLLDLYDMFDDVCITVPWSVLIETHTLRESIRNKITSKLYTRRVSLTPPEISEKHMIRQILFGDRTDLAPNDLADIEHVFEAQKYRAAFFVTVDRKHILSKAHELYERFRLQVMSPTECLKRIEPFLLSAEAFYSDLFKDHP